MIFKALCIVSATVLPLAIEYFITYRYNKKIKKLKSLQQLPDNSYYHCIFWTLENEKCREHMYNNIECGDSCSVTHLQTILRVLASAKTSINMCMYHLTLRQVTDELIKARKRGVMVRIISDTITSRMDHSKIKLLKEKYDFDVRTPSQEASFMHHKYCVIDASDPNLRKMFFGSLNLTLQGSVANFEFVVITNNPQMIKYYNNEFELLWRSFNENN